MIPIYILIPLILTVWILIESFMHWMATSYYITFSLSLSGSFNKRKKMYRSKYKSFERIFMLPLIYQKTSTAFRSIFYLHYLKNIALFLGVPICIYQNLERGLGVYLVAMYCLLGIIQTGINYSIKTKR
jgi:hypothetical protein